MKEKLSPRLKEILDALPITPNMQILEIGCGPGALSRAIAQKLKNGHILGIDRSPKAITLAKTSSKAEIKSKLLSFKVAKIENFELEKGESRFDLVIAIRVGALDGRHPEIEDKALAKIAAVLKSKGRVFIDGGNPLKELTIKPTSARPKT